MDILYRKFSSIKNLELAWSRLKTSQNISYKNYYRNLFLGYELAKKENIKNLHERLRGNSYTPYKILKIFIPKTSGLHRPITFLNLDDQIVYQALCNVLTDKFSKQRKEVEYINVFSNILNRDINKPIFFLKKWQEGYLKFLKKIKEYYTSGFSWVAHFDLAAYYDTICHNALRVQISKRSYNDFCDFLKNCLAAWTSNKQPNIHHGIPQGPMASGFIGEIYMLPIDKILYKHKIKYVRYVDDIKIFGKTHKEVLAGVIILDRECKERGLIPQAKKYEIIHAKSIEEAIGKNPSITYQVKQSINSNKKFTAEVFEEAFKKESFDISKIRYILKTSEKNDKILSLILLYLNSHFHLTREFCIFLQNYTDSPRIAQQLFYKTIHKPSPYEYVEGQYWELFSKFELTRTQLNNWNILALRRLGKARNAPSLRIGLYKFIARTNPLHLLRWLQTEEYAFIQMILTEHIDPSFYDHPLYWKLIDSFLLRHTYDPSLKAIKELIYNLRADCICKIPTPHRDAAHVLSNTIGIHQQVDTIGQILKNRYSIAYSMIWHKLFSGEYAHANRFLHLADKAYYIDKNSWVGYTDSFNNIFIRRFITVLYTKRPAINWPSLTHTRGTKTGQNIDFGVLMDSSNQLSRAYPNIINGIRKFHKRRCLVPTSHPYEKRTGAKTQYVTGKEQKKLSNELTKSYTELINILPSLV